MVENCDIMLKILHKHNSFERTRGPDNCDVRLIFWSMFFGCPHNYYNNNNEVIIESKIDYMQRVIV